MASTALTVVEPGGFQALLHKPDEIVELLEENLGGQKLTQRHLPRVKIPSGGGTTWEIPNGEPTKQLDGILVAFRVGQRAYWSSEELSNDPPDCRSSDGITGIGSPGGDCRTCPLSQFGSKGKGQACSQKEIWFLLQPGLFLPLVIAFPATSLARTEAYRIGTLGSALIRPVSVVTRIELETTKNEANEPYSRAVFSIAGRLSPEEAAVAREYAQAMAPLFDDTADAIADERPGSQPAAPAASTTAIEEEPVDDDDVPEAA